MARPFEIRWSNAAQVDLESILRFIADEDSAASAKRVYQKLVARIDSLQRHPRRCRIVPELRNFGILDYREMTIPPYRVPFRIQGPHVDLLGVLDGRRDLEDLLIQRALSL